MERIKTLFPGNLFRGSSRHPVPSKVKYKAHVPKLIKTSSSYQTRVKRGRFYSIPYKKEDKAVAEVIGAILLFAVLITLFTSFMVWYIPAQETANETHYETLNKAALGSLVSDLHSPSIAAGSILSATVPLGISGVSIFSQASDTQLSILPSSAAFNASITASLLLNLTGTGGTHTSNYVNLSYRIAGVMLSNGNTQYITAINYLVEDGSLFQLYGNNQPADNLGPLPLGITGGSSGHSISLSAMGLTGSSEIFSSTGSQVVNLLANTSIVDYFTNGTSVTSSGAVYTVNNMSLHSLNYTFNGTLAKTWDYAFFSQYNNSRAPYATAVALPGWSFAGSPFIASASNTSFSVTFSGNLLLNSFSSQYLLFQGD